MLQLSLLGVHSALTPPLRAWARSSTSPETLNRELIVGIHLVIGILHVIVVAWNYRP